MSGLIFMVHGFGDEPATFEPMAKMASARGWKCRSVAIPGEVGAGLPPAYVSRTVDFLAAMLRDADPTDCNVHLVGHSLGGLFCLFLASESSITPASLVLIEGTLGSGDRDFFQELHDAPEGDSGYSALLSYLQDHPTSHRSSERYLRALRRAGPDYFRVVVDDVIRSMALLPQVIDRVKLPTLYVYSQRSRNGARNGELAESFKWSLLPVDGDSHWPHEDDADIANPAILDWLSIHD